MKRYDHQAIEAPAEPGDENRRECRVCGHLVTGIGPTLVHEGENVRTISVRREDLTAFNKAVSAAELALSKVTERATDQERARVAVAAVYDAGLLRRQPAKTRAHH